MFLKNLKALLFTEGMLLAYCRWLVSTKLHSKTPDVTLADSLKIGGWISFSEYWSFRKGITDAEQAFIRRNLYDESGGARVAVDIGANIGLFTVYCANFDSTYVHSFEPVPQTFARLKSNIQRNNLEDKVALNLLAVGAEEGIVQFAIFDDSPAVNRIFNRSESSAFSEQENNQFKTIDVAVTTLDKYCRDQNITSIDFLKVDVEGMESWFIEGAREMLANKSVKAILIEICPTNLKQSESSVEILYQSIVKSGYIPYRISLDGTIGSELTRKDLEIIVLENVALLPEIK